MPTEQEVVLKRKVAIYRKRSAEVSSPKYNFKSISTYMHILNNVPMAISKMCLAY